MRAVAAFLLSFTASTLAYSVLTPNNSSGWTNQGAQNLTWERVNTDPLNFTVVLDNQEITGFAPEVLAALVDGTTGFTQLNPQNGGWPTGTGFRVNLVQDAQHLDAILAQSSDFIITEANGTSSTTETTNSPTPISTDVTPSGSSNTSPTITIPAAGSTTSGSASGGAAASYPIQTGLLALFSLLGFTLAS